MASENQHDSGKMFVSAQPDGFWVVFDDGKLQHANGPHKTEEEAQRVLKDILTGPDAEWSIIQ